jgi:hypothetical protein
MSDAVTVRFPEKTLVVASWPVPGEEVKAMCWCMEPVTEKLVIAQEL